MILCLLKKGKNQYFENKYKRLFKCLHNHLYYIFHITYLYFNNPVIPSFILILKLAAYSSS